VRDELVAQPEQEGIFSAAEAPILPGEARPVDCPGDQLIGASVPAESTASLAPDTRYLRYGPVFLGQGVAAQTPKTATERALELDEKNAHLSEEITNLKRQVVQIQSQLEITNASLGECIEDRKTTLDELEATRSEMTEWQGGLRSLSELIRANERSHLKSLDELIDLTERLLERDATPVANVERRQGPANTNRPRQSEFQQ